MAYQINTEKFWLAGTEDSGFVVGSGDVEMTIALPENVARLIAKAPDLKAALAWALDQIEDDLDPAHQAALAHARSLLED